MARTMKIRRHFKGKTKGGFFGTLGQYLRNKKADVGNEDTYAAEDQGDIDYTANFLSCKKSNVLKRFTRSGTCRRLDSSRGLEYKLLDNAKNGLLQRIESKLRVMIGQEKEVNKKEDAIIKKAINDFYVRTSSGAQSIGDKSLPGNIPKSTKVSVVFPASAYLKQDMDAIRTMFKMILRERRAPVQEGHASDSFEGFNDGFNPTKIQYSPSTPTPSSRNTKGGKKRRRLTRRK